jgi:DtxR family transcriptional regulator, Mn-dependent transcriptional regulator
MTSSVENYIKAIYLQSSISDGHPKLSTIAGVLNISNAAATDMAKKLSVKGLVNYTKYKPLALTSDGNELALRVIRKHRLWESFLYKTLNLTLHEIHREAEHLEHLTSDFLADRIEKYLGTPSTDPHGEPIPTHNGSFVNDDSQVLLSKAKPGHYYEISKLSASEKDFFDFCTSNHISIGRKIWIEKQFEAQTMTEIKINKKEILLNREFASIIFVKQVN